MLMMLRREYLKRSRQRHVGMHQDLPISTLDLEEVDIITLVDRSIDSICSNILNASRYTEYIIIIIRSASHTVALVQTKIATYTKKINLKSKSKYTKERFYLNQY